MIEIYFVSSEITSRLDMVLQNKIQRNEMVNEKTHTVSGFQTKNLMNDKEIIPIMQQILEKTNRVSYIYRWFHLISYHNNGFQTMHNHSTTEDLTYILYLNDCDSGHTVLLSYDCEIRIKPEKNKLLMFPSFIDHYAEKALENKKIAVGALKLSQ